MPLLKQQQGVLSGGKLYKLWSKAMNYNPDFQVLSPPPLFLNLNLFILIGG